MRHIVTTVPPDLEALNSPPVRNGLQVEIVDRRRIKGSQLIARLLAASDRCDAVLLNGSGRHDQLAAALIQRRRRRRAQLVISDATWARGRNIVDRAACWLGIRAIDGPNVTYCVLSSAELETFPRTWGVPPERIAFTPFCHTLVQEQLRVPVVEGQGIFAGGDSMRDYGPLLDAARSIDRDVRLAVKRLPRGLRGKLPRNVRAGSVPHRHFLELMRQASVVVVPLRPGVERSAGQQTYLNAMALGKAVVVTDSPGARDYVTDRVTGLIVPAGDADALANALEWLDDPENADEVRAIRGRALRTAREDFSPQRHFDALLDVVAAAVNASHAQPASVR
jgi:hypothetical protein